MLKISEFIVVIYVNLVKICYYGIIIVKLVTNKA